MRRQSGVYLSGHWLSILGDIGRAAGPQTGHVCDNDSAFDCLDDAVLWKLGDTGVHCNGFAWIGQRFNGIAGYYVHWRDIVCATFIRLA